MRGKNQELNQVILLFKYVGEKYSILLKLNINLLN